MGASPAIMLTAGLRGLGESGRKDALRVAHDFRTGQRPSLQVNNRPRIGESENEDRTELTEFCRIRGATRISDEVDHSARRNEKLTISKLVVSFIQDIACRFGCDQSA